MAKVEAHMPHAMLAVVALVAIVGISAIFMSMRIPYGWSQASWAETGHPRLEYPGQASVKDGASGGLSNLKETGSVCSSDGQCLSGACSIPIYDNKGEPTGRRVCS